MDKSYNAKLKIFLDRLQNSEAIVAGAASGMSAASGFCHYYQRDDMFVEWLEEFEKKYGYHSSFDGFYYRYRSSEERWAYIARMTCCILDAWTGGTYYDIYELIKGKNYHILTTNQDGQFNRLFPAEKISAIQGDWKYLQCRRRCHDELYDAAKAAHDINNAIDNALSIPSELIPRCPKCGGEMEPWVRGFTFLEGQKYREEHHKLNEFLKENRNKKILFLELGVGRMTPMFIQHPFWQMTYAWDKAFYITINPRDALLPDELKDKGCAIHEDIAKVLSDARKMSGMGVVSYGKI